MNKEKFVETIENYVNIDRKLHSYIYKKYIKEMNKHYSADFIVSSRWGLEDNNTEIWAVVYNRYYCYDQRTITFNIDEFIEWVNKEDK